MKESTKKSLLKNGVCDSKNVDAMVGVIEIRAKKLDKCGRLDCNHEHMIPQLIEKMIQTKDVSKSRIELEKERLIKKGFKSGKSP
jgi:hypothetical protein